MAHTSSKYLFALLLLAALAPLKALPALADSEPQKRTISLVASGAIKTAPNKVDISTGVTNEAASAREALDKNTASMTKVIDTLKDEGIDPKDIQTTNFSVGSIYKEGTEGRAPVIVGYRVTNQVRITLHDMGKLGAILDKMVTLGANQIDSIEFGVEEPEALKDEARELALKNVTDNAKLYAEAAGVGLGPILSISEEETSYQPRFAPAATRMEVAENVPVEAGTVSAEVHVRVTWEIN